MQVIATLPADTQLSGVARGVQRIEALGFDTVHIPETVHDSLAVALLAAEHSTALRVRTSMTLAFPRSPMITALAAWDLARFSAGRFELGLATQVRGNIVGRFSMPWSQPAVQLGDYVRAVRAIFTAFAEQTPLHYEGSHYRFDRLQPYFNPGPSGVPAPPIVTGGVNRAMCETGGALADGFVTHPTGSHPELLRTSVLPALDAGARSAGRAARPPVLIASSAITAPDEAALLIARDAARREMAFLYSTPAYRPTLDLLGHQDLGAQLTALVGDQRWAELPDVLTDDVLAQLVPQGTYAQLPGVLADWYGGLCDGLALRLPEDTGDDEAFRTLVRAVAGLPVASTS